MLEKAVINPLSGLFVKKKTSLLSTSISTPRAGVRDLREPHTELLPPSPPPPQPGVSPPRPQSGSFRVFSISHIEKIYTANLGRVSGWYLYILSRSHEIKTKKPSTQQSIYKDVCTCACVYMRTHTVYYRCGLIEKTF